MKAKKLLMSVLVACLMLPVIVMLTACNNSGSLTRAQYAQALKAAVALMAPIENGALTSSVSLDDEDPSVEYEFEWECGCGQLHSQVSENAIGAATVLSLIVENPNFPLNEKIAFSGMPYQFEPTQVEYFKIAYEGGYIVAYSIQTDTTNTATFSALIFKLKYDFGTKKVKELEIIETIDTLDTIKVTSFINTIGRIEAIDTTTQEKKDEAMPLFQSFQQETSTPASQGLKDIIIEIASEFWN